MIPMYYERSYLCRISRHLKLMHLILDHHLSHLCGTPTKPRPNTPLLSTFPPRWLLRWKMTRQPFNGLPRWDALDRKTRNRFLLHPGTVTAGTQSHGSVDGFEDDFPDFKAGWFLGESAVNFQGCIDRSRFFVGGKWKACSNSDRLGRVCAQWWAKEETVFLCLFWKVQKGRKKNSKIGGWFKTAIEMCFFMAGQPTPP